MLFAISYSGIDSGSYYENQVTQTQSLYAAVTWIPTDKYKLEVNVDGYSATYSENNGFNRPTQNLIDNGQYFSGNVIGFLSGGVPVFGVPFPQNVQSGNNLVEPGGLVGLDRSIRLLRPGDGSYGKSIRGQAIQTFTINDNFSIVNNTFVQAERSFVRPSNCRGNGKPKWTGGG